MPSFRAHQLTKKGMSDTHLIDLARRVFQLGGFLRDCSGLWRPAPFHHDLPPWVEGYSELHAALLALTPEQVDALHADEQRLRHWLERFIPGMAALEPLIGFERLQGPPRKASPVHAPARDVPGRKWAQIDAFAGLALDALEGVDEVWDWCAGKAHLGRLIGMHSGVPVRALERDPALCADAQRLAQRDGVRLTAQVCDVLSESAESTPTTLACALHACGDLHLTLLDQVGSRSPAGLLLAPCCYHRTVHEHHRPRSSAGRACGLRLSREDLRLAVLETCTAGHAQREAEKRRKARLLALKGWGAQHGLEVKDYSPLKDIGRDDDRVALQRACERLGWPVPDAGQAEDAMRTGWKRSRDVRAFELIRAAVRRPLEVWLVLDMALGLADEGHEVEVGEFCGRELTPRNLLIRARRRVAPRPAGDDQESAPGWP
jgi:hypothetical protein